MRCYTGAMFPIASSRSTPRTPVFAGLLVSLAALLSSTPAAAQSPPSYQGIRPPNPTALVLDQELVRIDCPPARDVLRCAASAHYVIANTSDTPLETDAPVMVQGLADVHIVIDGQPWPEAPWQLHVSLAPGARTVIDVSFSLEFASKAAPSGLSTAGVVPAIQARHPLLAGDVGEAPSHPVIFTWSRNWAAVRGRNFDVHYPSGWKLHGSQWRAQGAVTERSVSKEISDSDVPVDVDLRRVAPAVPVAPGGPVVAAGSALGQGFRMRYGYEFGVFDWMIPSVTADVDYAGLLVMTPTVEAASAASFPVPSFSAGFGMPIRVRPETRAGARLKLSAAMAVGLEATIDYYPSQGDWETTLAARLSL